MSSLVDQGGFPWQNAALPGGSGFAPGSEFDVGDMSSFPKPTAVPHAEGYGFLSGPQNIHALPGRMPSTNAFMAYLGGDSLVSYPALAGSTAFRSDDYGRTWQPFVLGLEKTGWASNGNGFGIISGGVNFNENRILVTNDFGRRWREAAGPVAILQYARAIYNNYAVVFGFGSSTALVTRDYGATWQSLNHGGALPFNAAAARGDGTVLAIARGTNTTLLSRDMGHSWAFSTLPNSTSNDSTPNVVQLNNQFYVFLGTVADRRPLVALGSPLQWRRIQFDGDDTLTTNSSLWFFKGRYWLMDAGSTRCWSSQDGFLFTRCQTHGAGMPVGTSIYCSGRRGPVLGTGTTSIFYQA